MAIAMALLVTQAFVRVSCSPEEEGCQRRHGYNNARKKVSKHQNLPRLRPIYITLAVAAQLLLAPALARNNGQWANSPLAVRQWFQSLMQPDHPFMSCCGEADAYEADAFEVEGDHYVAIITDGKGLIPNGTRIPVPNTKMKFDAGNPTGHGIIFIGRAFEIYCFVAPGGV